VVTFITTYPLGAKRVTAHMKQMISNCSYVYEDGRQSSFEALATLVRLLPLPLLEDHAASVFLPMTLRLVRYYSVCVCVCECIAVSFFMSFNLMLISACSTACYPISTVYSYLAYLLLPSTPMFSCNLSNLLLLLTHPFLSTSSFLYSALISPPSSTLCVMNR
jgi:hypothetical protein